MQVKDRLTNGLVFSLDDLAGFILVGRQQTGAFAGDFKVAGVGGTSTGATYQDTGTIGQPDASGVMSGGSFTLTGGFWSLISVVQTPGAPLLTITYANHQAIVSWPSSVTGWMLQTNNNLATGIWGNYPGQVVNNSVTNSPPKGNVFFRLSHP